MPEEDDAEPEAEDLAEIEGVEVAGVKLDIGAMESAAAEEGEHIAEDQNDAAAPESEDELDEQTCLIDESWDSLPSEELTQNEVTDAMTKVDGSLLADLGSHGGQDQDDNYEDDRMLLFELEQAHADLRKAGASEDSPSAPEEDSEAATEAGRLFLLKRAMNCWMEHAIPALELSRRIDQHNQEHA